MRNTILLFSSLSHFVGSVIPRDWSGKISRETGRKRSVHGAFFSIVSSPHDPDEDTDQRSVSNQRVISSPPSIAIRASRIVCHGNIRNGEKIIFARSNPEREAWIVFWISVIFFALLSVRSEEYEVSTSIFT